MSIAYTTLAASKYITKSKEENTRPPITSFPPLKKKSEVEGLLDYF